MAIRPARPAPARRQEFPVSKFHGRRMREDEYLALPEEKPYLEYIDGMVLQKPMPNKSHSRLVKLLILAIAAYEQKYGGDSGPEQRVALPDRSGYRIPDTAFWAPGRDNGDDSVPSLAVKCVRRGRRWPSCDESAAASARTASMSAGSSTPFHARSKSSKANSMAHR